MKNYKRYTRRISDHAFIRYLERELEIDVEKLKNELLKKFPDPIADGRYIIGGDTFICENNTVITFVNGRKKY